ncbi:hypothetical protein [Streptomyces celluloflavus]|uniref:hypothetical protein n=1 Tax=Streptomyces celluloflavus TaxID=58344 RepID=UPI0036854800
MTPEDAAATIIDRARQAHGSADGFDLKIVAEGLQPYGDLYSETYRLANEDHPPVKVGDDEAKLAERRARADLLWQEVLPHLRTYANGCRRARYTGWSRASNGPVRRHEWDW